jgi:hypothetical protein
LFLFTFLLSLDLACSLLPENLIEKSKPRFQERPTDILTRTYGFGYLDFYHEMERKENIPTWTFIDPFHGRDLRCGVSSRLWLFPRHDAD